MGAKEFCKGYRNDDLEVLEQAGRAHYAEFTLSI